MNYWLLKSEPNTYSWDTLVQKGRDHWDGVRNYQARNNLKSMKVGDLAIFYHSVHKPAAVGIVKIVREHYPDPTINDERWVVVDVEPVSKLQREVTLTEIKANPKLEGMVLIKSSRLSVQPVKSVEFDEILYMAQSL